MNNEIILQQYSKYLEEIGKCKNREIPTNFRKFKRFLNKNASDDLCSVLNFASIGAALNQISDRQINLKNIASDWNPTAVKKCYGILDLLMEIEQENSKYAFPNLEPYKTQVQRFFDLAMSQDDPCVELFLWKSYKNYNADTFSHFEKQAQLLLQSQDDDCSKEEFAIATSEA